VSKSDTRFFNLMRSTSQEPWGIISEVTQDYGTTKVNIHGVVLVSISHKVQDQDNLCSFPSFADS